MAMELNRREVIRRALLATGATALAANSVLLNACASKPDVAGEVVGSFTQADIAWLDEIAETILPETETPGAKAAGVGPFVALMVTDTYSPEKQQVFRDGMTNLEAEFVNTFGRGVMEATPEQRLELVAKADAARKGEDFFSGMKDLTVLGYFSSEIGYTQALRYVETPGRYDPCVEHKPGERFWAWHA